MGIFFFADCVSSMRSRKLIRCMQQTENRRKHLLLLSSLGVEALGIGAYKGSVGGIWLLF